MAALRAGALGPLPPLSVCAENEAIAKEKGFDCIATVSVGGRDIESPVTAFKYGNLTVNLYRHPEQLIHDTCKAWVREYDYSGKNYSAVPFIERHPCALEARELYEGALATLKKG